MAYINLIGGNTVALEAIQGREPVYSTPKLATGYGERTAEGEKAPDAECMRRARIREGNEQLSRYFETLDRQGWRCPDLLVKGKHDNNHLASRHSAYLCSFLVLEEVKNIEPPAASSP